MKKLEYESYFIDSQQEYVDEDEPNFKIDDEKTMSDSQILDLLNENEQLKSENKKLEQLNAKYLKDLIYFQETYKAEEVGSEYPYK